MAIPSVEVRVTADTAQAEAGLDRVGKAAIQAGRQTAVASGTMARLGTTFQRNGFAISNAANQFSDLAVQIGMGTPAARALSQQLPQITAFMGPLANVIGVASGVLIGIAGSFWAARDGASAFEDAIKDLEESTAGLKDELLLLTEGLDNLAQVAVLREIRQLQDEITAKEEKLALMAQTRARGQSNQVRIIRQSIEADREQLAILEEKLAANQNVAAAIETAKEEASGLADELGRGVTNADRIARVMRYATEVNNNGMDALDPRNPNADRPIWDGPTGNVSPFDPSRMGGASGASGAGGAGGPLDPTPLEKYNEALEMVRDTGKATWGDLGTFMQQFAGKSKAAAIATIAVSKGLAIAQAIQNTAVSVTKAMALDPTGVLAARAKAIGAIQVGIIAATGLAQAASAGGGGGSTGGGGGSLAGSGAGVAGPAESERFATLQITGDDSGIMMAMAEKLIPLFNELSEGGRTVRLG